MTPAEPWAGDINEVVIKEWIDETSNFERVKQVLHATTSYQYAGEIAKRARVSEPSARKHLKALADAGFAASDSTGQGTRFKRSREALALKRIRDLHTELDRTELIQGIRTLKTQIQSYRDTYDVTNPDNLAIELDAEDDAWAVISQWRAAEEHLDIAQAALSLYDFDPDRGDSDDAETTGSSTGAFAEDTDSLSA